MARVDFKPRSDAARHLKQIACRLFAERGVDGVTVREIAEAAGQKNHAAVGYHFGSKEALIRELVLDGAMLIDARRNAMLDALERRQRVTVRGVCEVLIRTSIELEGSGLEDSYNRFVVMLSMTHRDVLMAALDGRWNSGYTRCLDHLRSLAPDMSAARKTERLVFLGAYLGSVLSGREAALADDSREHPTWGSPEALDNFATTMAAIIEAKP